MLLFAAEMRTKGYPKMELEQQVIEIIIGKNRHHIIEHPVAIFLIISTITTNLIGLYILSILLTRT